MSDLSRITVDTDICHGKPCVRHIREQDLEGSETKDWAIAADVDANDMLQITKDGDFGNTHVLNDKKRPTRWSWIGLF